MFGCSWMGQQTKRAKFVVRREEAGEYPGARLPPQPEAATNSEMPNDLASESQLIGCIPLYCETMPLCNCRRTAELCFLPTLSARQLQ